MSGQWPGTSRSWTIRERLERQVDVDPNTGCHVRTVSIHGNGYSSIRTGGRSLVAHRIAYETFVGPIPDGLEIHHTCGVRACVNPGHLEAVTRAAHMAHHADEYVCKRGHRLSETAVKNGKGHRRCSACLRICRQELKNRRDFA